MMTTDEVVRDIHALEADAENYERRYGILSETFMKLTVRAKSQRTMHGRWIGVIGLERMKSVNAVGTNWPVGFS